MGGTGALTSPTPARGLSASAMLAKNNPPGAEVGLHTPVCTPAQPESPVVQPPLAPAGQGPPPSEQGPTLAQLMAAVEDVRRRLEGGIPMTGQPRR